MMEGQQLNNSNIIRNISTDQSEILWNIMSLYNEGKPFECDMTASLLKFYGMRKGMKYSIPKPKILFDVCPQLPEIQKITPFERLPLDNASIGSIVVDLPFVISPKTCKSFVEMENGSNASKIPARFSCWYPRTEAYYNFYWWIGECERVLKEGGVCVYKMQNVISGSIHERFIDFAKLCGEEFGLYVEDELILEAKARMICSDKIKKQKHSRKFTSTFIVFRKNGKLANKTSCKTILQGCIDTVKEGMVLEVK